MSAWHELKQQLPKDPKVWLVTGVAGFIGSNLLETLLKLDQLVIGLDNFSTGFQHNLDEVQSLVKPEQWARFRLIEGDIRDLGMCRKACEGVDYVLHQAALGSVPRSIKDPLATNQNNVDGFLNMLLAAKDAGVKRFVYASSSSVYGDHPDLPKLEHKIGKCLSPYAVSKYVNELYADVFGKAYGLKTIGLRYFNVFGPRQNPDGDYAAVIPKWIAAMIKGEPIFINGDGETSRDFCYVENAVQANLLSAMMTNQEKNSYIFNVAVGDQTTLNQLHQSLRDALAGCNRNLLFTNPVYRDFRPGDVKHSLADISKSVKEIFYAPDWRISDGIRHSIPWYLKKLST